MPNLFHIWFFQLTCYLPEISTRSYALTLLYLKLIQIFFLFFYFLFLVGNISIYSKWKWKLCPTLCDPVDYTVHGILQNRILEWVAFPFSRGSPNPGIKPRSATLQMDCLPAEPQGKPIEGTIIEKIRTLLLWMSEEWLPLGKRTGLWPERGTHGVYGNLAMSCSYELHGYYMYVHSIIIYSNV